MREVLWDIHLKIGLKPLLPAIFSFQSDFVAFNVQAARFCFTLWSIF